MATLKYQSPSPYTVSASDPPEEDIKYKQYEQDLSLGAAGVGSKFGLALFGVGRAGTIHLSTILKDARAELLYLVDDDVSKWKKLKKYWNLDSVKFLKNVEAGVVYEDSKVRAVVVASPTFTHEEIVMKALNHDKGVFCEKPVSETYEQIKACYKRAKEVQQPLFCAFNRRFDPAFSSIKERVHRGEIGKIITVKTCSRDASLPSLGYLKSSAGIFHDSAVHDIDMVLYLTGEYPTKVMVMATANIPEIAEINDYDTTAIMLSFESGAIGIIDLNRHSTYGYDQRIEVFGDKGMMKAENQQPIHNVESYTERNVIKAPILYSFPSRYADGYQIEMCHFLNILEGKEELCVKSQDVLAVTRIASACEEAARTGKCIEINWTDAEL